MKIYGTPFMKSTLEQTLSDKTPNAIYIEMDYLDGNYNIKAGLTFAEDLANENKDKKIIIYGFDDIQRLWIDTKFRKFMAHLNTHYIKAPFSIGDLENIYSSHKLENSALSAVSDIDYKKNLISKLKHDYHHLSLREDVLKKAREELGFSGDDTKIKEKLFDYEPEQKIKPQFFEGVFCDVEGTLISQEKLNTDLVKELKDYSKEKPINIWTGSDLKDISLLLMKYDLEYPLLSKDWFRGCKAEIVIDDLDEKELEKMYGIKAKKFKKV